MSSDRFLKGLSSVLAFGSLTALSHADVLRVAADGTEPYATIQGAIDAASSADTILIRPGQYNGFAIDNKSLFVVAAADNSVDVLGSVHVQNLASQRNVQLEGLAIQGVGSPGHGLQATSNQGALRIQNCTLRGAPIGPIPHHGMDLFLCADVIVNNCELFGGSGSQPRAGNGLTANASHVSIFDSLLRGRKGALGDGVGGTGGRALRLDTSSQVQVFGCDLRGGDGGDGTNPTLSTGGSSGGAVMVKLNSVFSYGNSQLDAGVGGMSGSSPAQGPQSSLLLGNGTKIAFNSKQQRSLLGPARVQGGVGLGVSFKGEPGDKVFIYYSDEPYNQLHAGFESAWAVRPGSKRVFVPIAVIPATGVVHAILPTWNLGPLTDSRRLTFQARVKGTDGSITLTNPLFVQQFQCAFSEDCNSNGIPDFCDIESGISADCDADGIPDSCGFGDFAGDCNGNGVPDACELANGSAQDCDGDLVPDDCQPDCNSNGIADVCDISAGFSQDCDGDLVPDECNIDCNNNGLPDACDISAGTSSDLNGNGVPDECQVAGTTYYVDAAAGPGGTGTLQGPFDAIGTAVSYALSGDTILVFDGTYTGSKNRDMDFGTRSLSVLSINGASNCVIDLEGNGRAFQISGTQTNTTRIEGFTIRRGFAVQESSVIRGGSAVLVLDASPLITDCVFEDCKALSSTIDGGGTIAIQGLQASGAGALIQDCDFKNCEATWGAGIFASDLQAAGVTVADTVFRSGRALGGAGIYSENAKLTVRGCEFIDGFAPGLGSGAGVLHTTNGQDLTITGSSFIGHVATNGGALYAGDAGNVLVQGCTLAENFGGFGGAAFFFGYDSCALSHNVFADNTAAFPATPGNSGGAALFYNFTPGAFTSVDNNLFFGNSSQHFQGLGTAGALGISNGDNVDITNCSFFLNTADAGGAVQFSDEFNVGLSNPRVRNSLFWENRAGVLLESILVKDMDLDYDYNNGQDGLGGITLGAGGSITYGAGNSKFYPGFVDPDGPDNDISTWEDNDVRLSPNSAARDAGDNAAVPQDTSDLDGDGNTTEPVPFDLAGADRLVDSNQPDTGNGPAPIVDLGCYEDQ